jgi:hypothetical protein
MCSSFNIFIILAEAKISWSPDGAHITASNATNQNGLVFIATVILRDQWTHEISLVGHENTVEVAVSKLCIHYRWALFASWLIFMPRLAIPVCFFGRKAFRL